MQSFALRVSLLCVVAGVCLSAPLIYPSDLIKNDHSRNAPGVGSDKIKLPIVLWHGMGDSCCSSRSIGYIAESIRQEYKVFVHSIGFGSNAAEDVKASYFGNVNDQVADVCGRLEKMDELKEGFDMVGFSQGGQFLRAVVERCHHKLPPIRYLITIGGQHQGIMNVPSCTTDKSWWCKSMEWILNHGAYLSWTSTHIVQAQYVKDPNNLDDYLRVNPFLPDVNNEHETKNELYKTNLAKVQAFIMFRFRDDTVVVPRDSAWFSFYNGTDLVPIRDQQIYKEDWIGLKELDERDAMKFDEIPSQHMHFTWDMFKELVLEGYVFTK